MKNYLVKLINEELGVLVLEKLYSLAYGWEDTFENRFLAWEKAWIGIRSDGILLYHNSGSAENAQKTFGSNYKIVTIEQIFTELKPYILAPKIKLNEEYTAEVRADRTIKVGCQTIPFEKVEELFSAATEYYGKIGGTKE